MPSSSLTAALAAFKKGNFVIVTDDIHRENEGDLILAAEYATPEQIAFMIRHTGGVLCLALSHAIADRLDLPFMVQKNTSRFGTPFTVSVDAAEGITTGISAADRAKTMVTMIAENTRPADLRRPGHVFPLRAADGGVLARPGHTEAAIDLCIMTQLKEGAVLSELMDENGVMMRRKEIEAFAETHDIPVITIAELIKEISARHINIRHAERSDECRSARSEVEAPRTSSNDLSQSTIITLASKARLETDTGLWNIRIYRDRADDGEHVALTQGTFPTKNPALVRLHSECLTGDALGSLHCDCGGQLQTAMEKISQEGAGVLLYMRQEGRGIGLSKKIEAYQLQQEQGLDTVEANERLNLPSDAREYRAAAAILHDLGATKVRLLTNNPRKIEALQACDIDVTERVSLEVPMRSERQRKYLKAKKGKLGHILSMREGKNPRREH